MTQRGPGLRAVAVLLVLATVSACSTDSGPHPDRTTSSPTRAAGATASGLVDTNPDPTAYTYSFKALGRCRLGDGLTVLENSGPSAVRLASAALVFTGSPGAQQVSYRVLSVPHGAVGEVADSSRLTALKSTHDLGRLGRAVLPPSGRSGRWYVLIGDVHVTGDHSARWGIDGLRVTYRTSSRDVTKTFAQSVVLPRTQSCGHTS